ncbi:golgin subfamily A member 8A isoform X2 [Rhinopithecus roxellana]|uniref:golgin subfamily A member 8A isoform X2 n=1 Tax=Rhinopithecus roxellana TaxID=61622 RepID=UPI001237731D|nr:golgin subfamily A member 8A isoform X2 [Rhinopithecus roxellana]
MFLSFSFSTCLAFLPKVQIQSLNMQKGKLTIDLYRTKRSLRYFEEESRDLAGRLQCSLQHRGELEQALSAVVATQKKKANQSSRHKKAYMEWKLERSIQEQALLKAQLTQLKESLKQAQLERDEYAQHLEGERARWQQRMRKMSQEVRTLKEERQHDMRQVEKLERRLSTLKNQMAEPLPPEPPAVPPEEELQHLRKELERVSAELQAQVENNQREHLEAASQQNQQLQDQLNLMALPGEGDGGGHLDSEEEGPRPMPSVPEDLESWEAMVPFFNSAGASAQEEQAQLREQETEQRVCCQRLAHTVASAEEELEAAVPAPGTGGESVIGETQPGLWEVMEKLESGLMDLLEEQTDLRERVEKLQVQFIQYWRERCHQKIRHLINEPGGNVKDAARGGGHHQAGPGLGGDEGKAAGASGDAVGACSDYSEGHSKLLASSQNPADEPGPGAPVPQELGAAHKHGDLHEMSLTDSEEPAQGEDTEGSPHNNPTAQPIVQEHQENQEHPGFGSKRPVPFFCWAWLPRRRR